MKCNECGAETPGVDHNNRGLRCTFCFARLVVEPAATPEPEAELGALHQPLPKSLVRPKAKRGKA
jgi:DNA-directed RNA polymerase subunit RPC12/RpoP